MTRRRQRNDEAAGRRAQAAALAERVRPQPAREPVDIATQVRTEIDRQRAAERDEATRLKLEQLRGGPCVWCGRTVCAQLEEGGQPPSPGWNTVSEGAECAICTDWRGSSSASEYLDAVAAIAADEGLAGLRRPVRTRFRHAPGLAADVGLVAWRDSGAPAGTAWAHVDVERVRTIATAPVPPPPAPPMIDHPAGCFLCGASRSVKWHTDRIAGREKPHPRMRGHVVLVDPEKVSTCELCQPLTVDGAAATLTGLHCRDGIADELEFLAFADTPGAKPDPDRRFAYVDVEALRARARELFPHVRDWARPALRETG